MNGDKFEEWYKTYGGACPAVKFDCKAAYAAGKRDGMEKAVEILNYTLIPAPFYHVNKARNQHTEFCVELIRKEAEKI